MAKASPKASSPLERKLERLSARSRKAQARATALRKRVQPSERRGSVLVGEVVQPLLDQNPKLAEHIDAIVATLPGELPSNFGLACQRLMQKHPKFRKAVLRRLDERLYISADRELFGLPPLKTKEERARRVERYWAQARERINAEVEAELEEAE